MDVAHIIKSPSYDSDGRLQKWVKSLKKADLRSTVHIIEDQNTQSTEMIEGTEIKKNSLFFRMLFKQRKGYPFKILEYCAKVFIFLKQNPRDVLIFHDVQQYLNIFIALFIFRKSKRYIVWDLHELPHSFLFSTAITKRFLRYLLENVDLVVYTNVDRRKFLLSKLSFSENSFGILNNFPDEEFMRKPTQKRPEGLSRLREDKPYIIWLGAALEGRNFTTFFEMFHTLRDSYNLVILGRVEERYIKEVSLLADNGIAFQAFVKQEEIINYIDHAKFSVVLYNSSTPNSYYCEPNRLYQLISRKIPVLVGNNPTMRSIVKELGIGIVLDDDGTSHNAMSKGLSRLEAQLDCISIRYDALNPADIFSWDRQFSEILKRFNL